MDYGLCVCAAAEPVGRAPVGDQSLPDEKNHEKIHKIRQFLDLKNAK